MAVTYESICEKLGFDIETYKHDYSGHEDDSKVNPFSIQTDEESDFLFSSFSELNEIVLLFLHHHQ